MHTFGRWNLLGKVYLGVLGLDGMILKEWLTQSGCFGVVSSGTTWGSVTGSCERGNKLGVIKWVSFLH